MAFSISNYLALDILLGAVALYVAKSVLVSKQQKKLPLPPGPKKLPLIGNLLDLPKGGRDWEHWTKHKDLYGMTCLLLHLLSVMYTLFSCRPNKLYYRIWTEYYHFER